MNFLPSRLRAPLFHRFIYPPSAKWHSLYEDAPLEYAPDISVSLNPQDRMHGQIAFLGCYEDLLSQRVVQLAKQKEGLFVDVGANIGYFSLLWVAQSPRNRAIAIEASPRVLPLLEENVQRNRMGEQIKIIKAAAGKEEGEAEFDLGSETETGWGGIAKRQTEKTVIVPLVRLDSIIAEPVELLKVDVEGADTWVLKGAEELLRADKIKHICFEHNESRAEGLGISKEEPLSYLRQMGYELSRLGNDHWATPESKRSI